MLEPQPPPTVPTPPRRRKRPARPRPDHCLNCGTAATGNFCAHCGQETKDHTIALRPLLADLLAEVASWDSKLLRTLSALVFRPGFLTNEYNAGRRVPYLSPLKLYLTLSVLFFLLLGWKHPLVQVVQFGVPAGRPHANITFGGSSQPLPHTAAEYDAAQKRLPVAKRDSALERLFIHHVIKAGGDTQSFLGAMLNDIPKMMFFLLPAFAVSLKLLYLRTKRLYVEHLIFLLHVHAFAFLALTPLLFLDHGWLVAAVGLILVVYLLFAMRSVYKQGWPKTLLKFGLLGVGYVFLLSLCVAGTALVALLLL